MTIKRFVQGLFAVLLLVATVTSLFIVYAAIKRRALVQLQLRRFQSYQAADELRHSSDDLTRFARSFAATGDPQFERYYNDVLAIRNGEKPRPQNYERIYWDFVVDQGDAPRPAGAAVSLAQRMRNAGFTEQELTSLQVSLDRSNELVRIEQAAFHALKGEFPDDRGGFSKTGPPDRALAVRLVNDAAYHQAKARIMQPIDQFLRTTDEHAKAELDQFARDTVVAFRIIQSCLLLFLLAVAVSYPLVRSRVLLPVFALQAQTRSVAADLARLRAAAMQIAQGDFEQSFSVTAPPMHSQRQDEIGELSRLHDSMIGQLEDTGTAISSITGDLSSAKGELERKYQELRNLEQLRDDLTNMIVHDLRSPLTAIAGYLQFLQADGESLSEKHRRYVDGAASGTTTLIEMISSLLDANRLEAGEMPLELETCDLCGVATRALKSLEGLTLDRNVGLTLPETPVFVSCDPAIVQRIITNLVGNALKFTPKSGSVTVAILDQGNEARVEVRDTGYGIESESLDKVFDKFKQVQARAEYRSSSSGLGLTFCKLATEAHGGRIGVSSKVGEGSVFWFELAAARPAENALGAGAAVQ